MATGYFPCGAVIQSTGPKRRQKPRNDPQRMLLSYHAAAETLTEIKRYEREYPRDVHPIWTSHEALLLDYETTQIRTNPGENPI